MVSDAPPGPRDAATRSGSTHGPPRRALPFSHNRHLRILLVEDEQDEATMLAKGLREDSHAVDVALDGDAALERLAVNDYDLVILDVMLPRRTGVEVCRELRRLRSMVPILMLTARDAVAARVEGLDAGADDYLAQPFAVAELLARVRALDRRMPVLRPERLVIDDVEINTRGKRVSRAGQPLALTAKEYALLEFSRARRGERRRVERWTPATSQAPS